MNNANIILKNIKTRRVIRNLTDQPVEREKLEKILEAGRWAPAGGNQRTIRFIAVHNSEILRMLRVVSPGMLQVPQALILICHDTNVQNDYAGPNQDHAHDFIDIGTTMQNMMLAAHALGLGSGPVTSFSHEAVRVILNLPSNLLPRAIVCLGYKGSGSQVPMKARKKVTWQSLTYWDRFE